MFERQNLKLSKLKYVNLTVHNTPVHAYGRSLLVIGLQHDLKVFWQKKKKTWLESLEDELLDLGNIIILRSAR